MFPPRYTLLNLYASPQGYLAEIIRTTRDQTDPLREWIWIEPHRALTLQPLNNNPDDLAFEEGRLSCGASGAHFHGLTGRTIALERLTTSDLPSRECKLLQLHLS